MSLQTRLERIILDLIELEEAVRFVDEAEKIDEVIVKLRELRLREI
jgi:hypothetical protein